MAYRRIFAAPHVLQLTIAGPIVQAGGWRAGIVLAASLPALGLPYLLARRRLLPSQLPAVVEADPRPHQAVVDEAGLG